MTAPSELTAYPREVVGKASRRLAHEGRIPAVLYGPGTQPVPLAIARHDFDLFAAHHTAGATILSLNIEGHKRPVHAMIREVQHSAVKGTPLHIDFLAVTMDKPVHATVALHLVNDPAGVRAGGILTVNLHEINVSAKPNDLPEVIEFDVEALEIGDSVHIRDIVAPKGVELIDDPETIVASVQAPKVEAEVEEAAEAAEPEVIGKAAEEE